MIALRAREEMSKRRRGTDRFSSQSRASSETTTGYDGAILIALNSSWDSAALGLHGVFRSSSEWLVNTIKILLDTTAAQIVIRQHPGERFEAGRTSDNYRLLLQEQFGPNSRIHLIGADSPVNTYDLMRGAAFLVVHTSTLGVEAAAEGKVVLSQSASYYSRLGFIWRADTLAEYTQHLLNAAQQKYSVSPDMQERALRCFYLTQCCNWVFSPFTPENFAGWSGMSLNELMSEPSVDRVLTALLDNVPVAYLNHKAEWTALPTRHV